MDEMFPDGDRPKELAQYTGPDDDLLKAETWARFGISLRAFHRGGGGAKAIEGVLRTELQSADRKVILLFGGSARGRDDAEVLASYFNRSDVAGVACAFPQRSVDAWLRLLRRLRAELAAIPDDVESLHPALSARMADCPEAGGVEYSVVVWELASLRLAALGGLDPSDFEALLTTQRGRQTLGRGAEAMLCCLDEFEQEVVERGASRPEA
jgi:hypothetical protein